jgi:hypothetical protein
MTDLDDLIARTLTIPERVHSVRVETRGWTDHALSGVAQDRFLRLVARRQPARSDTASARAESRARAWLVLSSESWNIPMIGVWPTRWREELESGDDGTAHVRGRDGRVLWWSEGDGYRSDDREVRMSLHCAWVVGTAWTTERATLDVVGHDTVISKDAVRVRMVPDEGARRPAFPFGAGDFHELVVDAESGATLSLTNFVDGNPFQHHEVVDVELNALVPDALTAVPAGTEAVVLRPPLRGPGDLAAAADLQVLSPTRVPAGFEFDTLGSNVDRRNATRVQLIFTRERREFVNIFEMPASEPVDDSVYEMQEARRGDRTVSITDVSDAAGTRYATAELAGTRAIILCSLPANELLDLAFSLEVVTPTPATSPAS